MRYRNIWVRPLHRYDENAGKSSAQTLNIGPPLAFGLRQMLESQRERAHYTGWLMARGLSMDEARERARRDEAEFRPAFVQGRRRHAGGSQNNQIGRRAVRKIRAVQHTLAS